MPPSRLSRDLRTGSSRILQNRRGVAGLSLLASGSIGLISLYQLGLICLLPEPPLPGLDADRVDDSPEAYARMRLPMPDVPIVPGPLVITQDELKETVTSGGSAKSRQTRSLRSPSG